MSAAPAEGGTPAGSAAARDGRPDARGACGAAPLGSGDGARILAVDVGLGTADILVTQPGEALENAVKLVVPSRTQVVAAAIARATARGCTVVFTGPTMGGGASGSAMKAHLRAGHGFIATEEAALTFADDLGKVTALGVRVVTEAEAAAVLAGAATAGAEPDGAPDGAVEVRSGDLDPSALRAAFGQLGVATCFDAVAVAVQDHGFSPDGSNRVFRFALWERAVAERRRIAELFYRQAEIPRELTRLRAAAGLAAELAGGAPVLAADTGPAALYGALPKNSGDAVLVNVGNGHVICVVARAGRLAGVFEHHTGRLDGPGLEQRLRAFLRGELTAEAVREDGGHGAVLAPAALDAGALDGLPLIVTGPRRGLLEGSSLPLQFAAPHGDMMLTGCFGLVRAVTELGLARSCAGG